MSPSKWMPLAACFSLVAVAAFSGDELKDGVVDRFGWRMEALGMIQVGLAE